jgi:hypothetical protein
LRFKEAGIRAGHAAVKDLLPNEHKLYYLAFAESNVDRLWDTVIFSDKYSYIFINIQMMGRF